MPIRCQIIYSRAIFAGCLRRQPAVAAATCGRAADHSRGVTAPAALLAAPRPGLRLGAAAPAALPAAAAASPAALPAAAPAVLLAAAAARPAAKGRGPSHVGRYRMQLHQRLRAAAPAARLAAATTSPRMGPASPAALPAAAAAWLSRQPPPLRPGSAAGSAVYQDVRLWLSS